MKVTRTIRSDVPDGLAAVCNVMGFVRADIWHRYGALKNVGKSAADIRCEITEGGFYAGLSVDGTICAETTKDIVNDVLLYKAAAMTLLLRVPKTTMSVRRSTPYCARMNG